MSTTRRSRAFATRTAHSDAESTGRPMGRFDVAWCVGLFLGALVLRFVHLASMRDSPFFRYLMLDPLMYDEWGLRIASGDWFGNGAYFQDPLYAYFLGAFYALVGHNHTAVVAVQFLLGSSVPVLIYLASKEWFESAVARVAGVLAAVYLPAIYFEGLVLKTALVGFLVSLALWLLSLALAGRGRWLWFAAGLTLGLACLTRGNLVLFLPALALWLLMQRDFGSRSARPWTRQARWQALGLLALGCLVILGPTAVRNRVAGGGWILTTSNAGQNFFIGNNPLNTDGEYQPLPFIDANPKHEERDFAREAQRRTGRPMSPAQLSRFWFGQAWRWIWAHPGDWLRLTWVKFRNYWGAYEIPDNLDYYLYRQTTPVLRLPIPGFGLVAPLGLLGAVLAARRRGWPRLLLVFLIVYSFSVILFFVVTRFRVAMMPALFVVAGSGVVELWRRWRGAVAKKRPWRPAISAGALFLVCFGFVNLPVRTVENSWSHRVGRALHLPLRIEDSAIAHFNLGVTYGARARNAERPDELLELAEYHLRQAATRDPDKAIYHINLGKSLSLQRREREAIEAFRKAEALEPLNYRIHYDLGRMYRRVGELPPAEREFRRSLELAPRHAASATGLGDVLLEQGRPEEAAAAFRYALRLSPNDRAARDGLRTAELSGF
jgi:4-amino-4-deoxy-L-arabinose transferase-like glycosyltransferase/Tfp pilus assembly protein PilF